MFDATLQFLCEKSVVTDLILLCGYISCGVISAMIPRTQDKMLGKFYGREKTLRVYVKDILTVLWFLFCLLFLFRAIIIGIGSFSFFAIFLYLIVFFLSLSIVLMLNSLVEKRYHSTHSSDIDKILNDNPIYKKCIEECNNNDYKAIYILEDKIIISNEQVASEKLKYSKEILQTFLVDSKRKARHKAKIMAQAWKKQIVDNLSAIKGSFISFSAYGFDLISDESMYQFSSALSDKLALKVSKIEKTFSVEYTEPWTPTTFVGQGATLTAVNSHCKTYTGECTVTAAIVLYKPLPQASTEKSSTLTKW